MNLTYEFTIWTSYIEQMNKIVEKINYSDGAYWGEPGKMKFKSSIESFSDASQIDGEKLIQTTFSVNLYGYILPETFDGKTTTQKMKRESQEQEAKWERWGIQRKEQGTEEEIDSAERGTYELDQRKTQYGDPTCGIGSETPQHLLTQEEAQEGREEEKEEKEEEAPSSHFLLRSRSPSCTSSSLVLCLCVP